MCVCVCVCVCLYVCVCVCVCCVCVLVCMCVHFLVCGLHQVDLQKSLRTLESKESELRRSKASLREKEAQLEVSDWQRYLSRPLQSCVSIELS